MSSFRAKLLEKNTVANDTTALVLEKPKGFNFLAGQYIDLGIIDENLDDYERFRTLTLGSAPSEDLLLIAYRNRKSDFKNEIDKLKIGSLMEIQGPFGRFILPPKMPVAFLAGGIGIVPFLSMIRDEIIKNTGREIILFYSNHKKEDVAFLDELNDIAKKNTNFKFIPTLTAQSWVGETGYITSELIEKYIPNIKDITFFICGTPDMVMDLRWMLQTSGVDSLKIRTETFDGY